MTVFVFPTLANPAALDEQELREELQKANHQILALCEERDTCQMALAETIRHLGRIVAAHLKNEDVAGVIEEVIEQTRMTVSQSERREVH